MNVAHSTSPLKSISCFAALLSIASGLVYTLPSASAATWTGATDSDWDTASNWDPAAVPTSTTGVVFDVSSANITAITSSSDISVQTLILSGTLATPVSITSTGTLTLASDALYTTNLGGNTLETSVASATLGNRNYQNGTWVLKSGSYTMSSSASKTIANDFTFQIDSGASLTLGTGTSVTLAGNIILNGGGLYFNAPASAAYGTGTSTITLAAGTTSTIGRTGSYTTGNFKIGSALVGSGTLNVANGSQPLGFNGDNSAFTGIINIGSDASATVNFRTANSGSAGAIWNMEKAVSVRLEGAGASFGALMGLGTLQNAASNATDTAVIIGGRNESTATYSGVISDGVGTIAVTKTGTGEQVFTGNNTYTGGTLVDDGTLKLTGAGRAGTGAITVGDGAVFDFSGITGTPLANAITLEAGGIVLGATSNLVSLGNGSLVNGTSVIFAASGATLELVLGESAAQIFSSNLVALDNVTLNLDDSNPLVAGAYTLLTVSSGITGAFTNYTDGYTWQVNDSEYTLSYLSNSVVVNVALVPEPSTYALFGALGVVGLLAVRRRRG